VKFARDFHALNDLYNNKIVTENVGLGPLADQDSVPSVNNVVKFKVPQKACNRPVCGEREANQSPSEDCEGYNPETYDSNGKMTRQLLFRIFKLSAMLHDLLNGKENVEAWVLSKVTNAHDQLESVFGYEDYEKALSPMHGMCGAENFEESNEEELYSAISRGGDTLLQKLNDVLKRESAETLEKVLFETILILEKKKKLS